MLAAILRHDGLALSDGVSDVTYAQLTGVVAEIGSQLRASGAKTIGIALDNSPLWGALDLAILDAGLVCVPLPGFFSPDQLTHVIADAGIDMILTDRPDFFSKLRIPAGAAVERAHCGKQYAEIPVITAGRANVPAGTVKITYTSGTTGNPKGVCLDLQSMEHVAKSLLQASGAAADDRYLSLLPLSTLLENIGALYVPLLAGAACRLLPLSDVGLSGAAKLDVEKMAGVLSRYRATCAILTPQLLQALTGFMEKRLFDFPDLRFVAVGGAPVSGRLLERSASLGLPVFEGYGLSECASVVSLNTEAASKPGSAGKPLPHVSLKFAPDGEIFVRGAVMLGYCGMDSHDRNAYWPTGDTGYLDHEGFLHLTGRKKNIFITAFGRNVAPEWVEKELAVHPAILQAAVFGEGRPWNAAVVVPRDPGRVEEAVRQANDVLPDYARIREWCFADGPFLFENGQLTANGRLKREAIWPLYREKIEALYERES